MDVLNAVFRNYWFVISLWGCGWFIVHNGIIMARDVRAQRHKLAIRQRAGQSRRKHESSAASSGSSQQETRQA